MNQGVDRNQYAQLETAEESADPGCCGSCLMRLMGSGGANQDSSLTNGAAGQSGNPQLQQQISMTQQQQSGAVPPPRIYAMDDPETELSKVLGRLQFSVIYDYDKSILTVKVARAVNLKAMDVGGTSDPYVKVILLPDKSTKVKTDRTRKTCNPTWNEVFAYEEFPKEKVAESSLFLQVLDYDRFSKDDAIGEVVMPLEDFDLVRGQTIWKNLQPPDESRFKSKGTCTLL